MKLKKKHWILLIVGTVLIVVGRLFVHGHVLSAYTFGRLAAILLTRPIRGLAILSIVALVVAALRRNVRRFWFPALAWLFLAAGVLDVGVAGYWAFVLRPKEPDAGKVENSVYRNEYFGLTLKLPPDWTVPDEESQRQLLDKGIDVLAGEDKNLRAVMKASGRQTVFLLTAFKYPPGAPVLSNPSMVVFAESVRGMPGIKRGSDYHFHGRKLLESGTVEVSFPEEPSTEQLGGLDFDVLHMVMPFGSMNVKQRHYTAVMKGYALTFAVTFTSDEEQAALERILESVTFKK